MSVARSVFRIWTLLAIAACDLQSHQRNPYADPARPDTIDRVISAYEQAMRQNQTFMEERNLYQAQYSELLNEVNALGAALTDVEREYGALTSTSSGTMRELELAKGKILARKIHAYLLRLSKVDSSFRAAGNSNVVLRKEIDETRMTLGVFRSLAVERARQISLLQAALDSANETIRRREDEVDSLSDELMTGFYVVGTKQELLEAGIIEEVGGARTLLIGPKGGKVLRPKANGDERRFTRMRIDRDTLIVFPSAGLKVRILSTHDLGYTSERSENTRFAQNLFILNPRKFWSSDRRLIILIER